jgi:hypothetical protein
MWAWFSWGKEWRIQPKHPRCAWKNIGPAQNRQNIVHETHEAARNSYQWIQKSRGKISRLPQRGGKRVAGAGAGARVTSGPEKRQRTEAGAGVGAASWPKKDKGEDRDR